MFQFKGAKIKKSNYFPTTIISAFRFAFMQQIKNIVFDLGGIFLNIDFSKTEKILAIKFKEINKKYHQKRTSKSLLLAKEIQHVPNNQNQSMTISSDEW